jgi:hypothetical protein
MSAAQRWFAISATVALLAGLLCATATGAGTVQFTIALSARSYAAGGPVPLDMTLTNASPATVRVNRRLAVNDEREPAAFREVTFDVRTPSGKRAPFRLDIKRGAARPSQLVSLKPHGSVRKTVDLARYYALHETGTYEVTATYASAAPGAEHGPVTSNGLRFTVR